MVMNKMNTIIINGNLIRGSSNINGRVVNGIFIYKVMGRVLSLPYQEILSTNNDMTYLGVIEFTFSRESPSSYRCGISLQNDINTVVNWLEGEIKPTFNELENGTYYCFAVNIRSGRILTQSVVIDCSGGETPNTTTTSENYILGDEIVTPEFQIQIGS
jgi:hypothetical protein